MRKALKLFKYVVPYWLYAALNVLFNIVSAIAALFSTIMVIPFLQVLFEKQQVTLTEPGEFALNAESIQAHFSYYMSKIIVEHGQFNALIFVAIFIVVATLLKTSTKYLSLYFLAPLRHNLLRDIRVRIFNKVLRLPLSYFSETRKGDLLSRMSNDVKEVEVSIVSSIEMLFRDPITIIIFMVMLFYMSTSLTLFVLIMLPFSGFMIGRIGKKLRGTARKGQSKMGLLLSIIEETLSGLRIIKAFNAEKRIGKRFVDTNNMITRIMVSVNRRSTLASPLSEFIGTISMVIIMVFGGSLVLSNASSGLSGEALIAYLMLFYQIIAPAKAFSSAYYNIQKGAAALDRIDEIIDAEETISDLPDAKKLDTFSHKIEYRNVSFRYDDEDVLKNINLVIEKGKTIAIVGHSGSGKSTLVNLLPRFYDCTEGEVLIDDIPIKQLTLHSLRSQMGIVTQDTILFNDNFFNNISFGQDGADINTVTEAAKVANAHDFISESPGDYYFNIGDRGDKLSGGQKQRISIARAVFKNPPIMILDEATSALDTESERLVQDAITRLMQNRTSLVIAHRLSTIKHADEIIVLENGRIAERGAHDELLAKNSIYSKLHEMQSFVD